MDAGSEPAVASAPRARWALVLACVLPVLCAFAPRDLWSPDEPRYGRVAHEMVATGDWLVPQFDGLAYPEKPPLVFWMQAAVESAVGARTPAGARLPAALLAALATWLVARFASKRLGGPAVGDTAAIVFATTALVLWNSSRAGLDLPITAFGLVALDGGADALLDRSWGGALRFGAGIGLGLLAKGPHALYLPVAGLVGGAVWIRRGNDLLSPRFLVGLLLGVAIFAAWLVPALATHAGDLTATGDSYRARLLGQIASRVSGEDEPHAHGPLFLWGLVVPMGLPWIAAGLLGLVHVLRAGRRRGAPRGCGAGAAAWGFLVPLLLLSVPTSKRELYLIPPLAAAALLAAHAFHAGPAGPARRVARAVSLALGLLAVACVVAPFVAARAVPREPLAAASGEDLARGLPVVGWILAAVALAASEVASSRAASSAVAARRAAAGLAAGAAIVLLLVLPAYDPAKSTREVARVVNAQPRDVGFAVAGTSDLTALWNVDRARADRLDVDALPAALTPGAPPRVVLLKGKTWDEALEGPRGTALRRARVLWRGAVGGTPWVLVGP